MVDATIVCENMGDATLDTYFEWSLGTKESVTIATSDKISNLTICNLSDLLKNTIITCQVVIPLVATSNASATVIIYDDELIPSSDVTPTPGTTTDNSSHIMPPNDTYHTSVGTVVTISLTVSILFIICVLAFLCGLFIGKRRVSLWNILHRQDSDPVYTSVQNVNQHPQSESEVSEASAMQSLTGSNIQLHAPDNQTELRMKDDRSYANPDFSSSESDMTVQDGIFCPMSDDSSLLTGSIFLPMKTKYLHHNSSLDSLSLSYQPSCSYTQNTSLSMNRILQCPINTEDNNSLQDILLENEDCGVSADLAASASIPHHTSTPDLTHLPALSETESNSPDIISQYLTFTNQNICNSCPSLLARDRNVKKEECQPEPTCSTHLFMNTTGFQDLEYGSVYSPPIPAKSIQSSH